ncbi:hypothetical protein KIH74_05185 [Kineosporia sp. J2-2]|uniref:KAP family P-loop domain-containing protein n=1 Tax=Kineosporia corallincola TaxID=2835133 RepID=A0ABS5TB48_9ACTN|nr:hypothetical protein [Kineosporia corallincola]MBT0768305.1 hypothetical protein [Kineosporia corallincola]
MGDRTALERRQGTFRLLDALIGLPVVRGRRTPVSPPVLVVSDWRGGGKTAVLEWLSEVLEARRIPFAQLDLARNRPATEREIVFAAAYQVSRDWGRPYRNIGFARLGTVRQVMDMTLSVDPQADRKGARGEIERKLQSNRLPMSVLRGEFADAAGALVGKAVRGLGPLGPFADLIMAVARLVPEWLLGRLRGFRLGRQVVLGRRYTWFDARTAGRGPGHPADVLVDLYQRTRPAVRNRTDNVEHVDKLVREAFLADLTEHFSGRRARRLLAYGCVLMLDNADDLTGRRFVTDLAETLSASTPLTPLTVVVTDHGENAYGEGVIDLGSDADEKPWQPRPTRPQDPDTRIGLRRLAALERPDVGVVLEQEGVPGGGTRVTHRLMHELTDGHPLGTRRVAEALHRASARDGGGSWDPEHLGWPRRILALPVHDGAGQGESLRDWLLGELTSDLTPDGTGTRRPAHDLDTLVTWAPAADRSEVEALAALIGRRESYLLDYRDKVLGPGRGVTAAVARRVLLERLATRDARRNDSWDSVFRALARAGRRTPEREVACRVSLGEVRPAATYLAGRLGADPPADWLARLHRIAAAPHRPLTPEVPPIEEFHRRSEMFDEELGQDQGPPLLRVAGIWLIALWIAQDRLAGAHRRYLYDQMIRQLAAVRIDSRTDNTPFDREENRYKEERDFWP